MANTEEQKLFTQFPPVSTEKWEQVIAADLKGADYEKKLIWKTDEGFNVRPYYRAEDLEGISFLKPDAGEFPYVRGTKANNNWLIHETIEVADAKAENAKAKELLMRGAESIGFAIDNKEFGASDLDALLNGIHMEAIELVFSGCAARKTAGLFIDKVTAEGKKPEDVKASFVIDPILGRFSKQGSLCKNAMGNIAGLIGKAEKYPKIKLVGVNGALFHNSGSTIVQELAFTLAAGHEYIVRLMNEGLTIDQVAPRLRFSMAVSSNYFMEIAKFRAARMLWANIMEAYKPEKCCSLKMFSHAETSRWNMTVYDPYVNMLRGTTEAMSASIAGVHSLEVLPFDAAFEKAGEFSSRIARNTQVLLKEESHFDQVADASGGSYYIENLTKSIADNAWALFKQVEEKGGYVAAFEAGFIQDMIEKAAAKKDMNIATRRQILLGTNQYPNFNEVIDPKVPAAVAQRGGEKASCSCSSAEAEPGIKVLRPYRGGMAFEEMRMKVDRSGKEPKAFMLTVGSLAFARARAQFACNFFACAGIRVQDNTYFQSVDEGVKAAIAAKAEIVVICASDDDYATLAPEAYEKLGGKAIFVVAGAPASAPELEAKGIDHFISVRSNVLETLKQYLVELGIKE